MALWKFSMAFVVRNFVYNTPAMPTRWNVRVQMIREVVQVVADYRTD